MIDPLDIYLQGDYRDERAEIDRLQALSQHLLRVFSKYYEIAEQTWPYELVDGHEGEARGFSFSTTAMILFALAVALGKVSKSVLVPTVRLIPIPVSQDKHSKEAVDHLLETVPKVISTFIEKSVKQVDQGRVTESATFGDNDPFTLTWMLELLGAYPEQSHHLIGQGNKTYLGRFREIAKERIEGVFGDPEGDRQDRPSNARAQEPRVGKGLLKRTDERSDREYLSQALSIRNPKVGGNPITHAFPLLRFVQLYRLLVGSYPVHIDPALMRKALKNRIHLHLSLSAIPDTGFDAAEMVFSLEGVMLLNPDSPDLALIDRVFGVLAERQNVNPYWRPLRPLKVSSQGLTLLPQSVEVTNSLLRICGALERDEGRSHFSEHVDLFKRYARWLEARLYKATDGKFIGWESEHTYTGNTVHLWQTSQVLLLLQHYSGMLQRHIARRSL